MICEAHFYMNLRCKNELPFCIIFGPWFWKVFSMHFGKTCSTSILLSCEFSSDVFGLLFPLCNGIFLLIVTGKAYYENENFPLEISKIYQDINFQVQISSFYQGSEKCYDYYTFFSLITNNIIKSSKNFVFTFLFFYIFAMKYITCVKEYANCLFFHFRDK